MRIDIISAVPQVLTGPLEHSIVGRAREDDLVTIEIHDLRDFTTDKHLKIDDYPYGGGAGMILSAQPLFDCLEHLHSERSYDEVIFVTPDGELFDQQSANELSVQENIIIICGHYKGIDQRVRDFWVTKEMSIGDYVLSGGELAAMVITDAITRLLPGAIGDAESALNDSFQQQILDAPHYTRPASFRGHDVPKVLLSGDHKKIEQWREDQALIKTKQRRPDLLSMTEENRNEKQNQ